MSLFRRLASAAVLSLILSPAWPQSPGLLPPVEAFGALPALQNVLISPDGTHLLALQTYKGRTAAVIYQIGAPPGTTPAVLIDDAHYIIGARWLKNDRVMVIVYEATVDSSDNTHRAMPFARAFAYDLKFTNPVLLLKDSASTDLNYSSVSVADVWLDDPTHILMPLWAKHVTNFSRDLYSVDLATGKSQSVLQGRSLSFASSGLPSTVQWIMDGHGKPVARLDQQSDPLRDHLLLLQNDDWKEIAVYDAESDQGADIVGLTDDGKQLVRLDSDANGTVGVAGYDIATGTTATLFRDPKFDVSSLFVDDWTHRALGAKYVDNILKTHWFSPSLQALQNGLDAAFPGQNVRLLTMNQARDKVTLLVSSANHLPTYYYLDRNTHRASAIGSAYPKLRAEDLGTVKPYPYKARDGLDIPAYLTLPPGKPGKNLPVVIFPHGGPEARDAMDFDWWAQFMANRGYAVLQPNFRGSYGYGYAFRKAGAGQWGLKMQDDITDGVLKLIADGIADPKRICIVGASYGGYAALAGATFTPNLYACAASVAGVSDLPKMMTSEERDKGPKSKTMSYWRSRIGTDTAALADVSPARHADRVAIPILLMHGQSDYTVRIDQSIAENDALKRVGKNVNFVRFEGNEDHYLERSETRISMLTELEQFLKANIGN